MMSPFTRIVLAQETIDTLFLHVGALIDDPAVPAIDRTILARVKRDLVDLERALRKTGWHLEAIEKADR